MMANDSLKIRYDSLNNPLLRNRNSGPNYASMLRTTCKRLSIYSGKKSL